MNKTYRSIMKWGNPEHEEVLDDHTREYIVRTLGLSATDIKEKYLSGNDTVKLKKKSRFAGPAVAAFKKVVGTENVSTDDYERAVHAYGKFYLDLVKLRLGRIETPPDAVVYPRNEKDVVEIVKLCHQKKIPVVPSGGRSSVTRGLETPKGGIVLDLTRHMNRVVRVSEVNATVTVEPGIYGPALEEHLNSYGSGYTCGHFPQSFEYSTVGGWMVTRGAGQASTGYGKFEDMVLSLRMVTPRGIIVTKDYPACAMGPDIDQIIIGSEGTLGIITEVTMKIRRYRPRNTVHLSFLFKDFESSVNAMREMIQGGFGKPHLFRISDPEETDVAFGMKGMNGTMTDRILSMLGYRSMRRCLMFVTVEGEKEYARLVGKKISRIARLYGAFPTGASPAKKWLEQRYSSAYMRDPLMDMGVMTDTLETAVSWENLLPLWEATRTFIKSRPDTICMVHISHVYENGANLYFIFLSPMKKGKDVEDFETFHRGIIDTIHANGGSLSHHHGIGRMLAPWMKDELGETAHDLLLAVKDFCDPRGIMNPGGTLGLRR